MKHFSILFLALVLSFSASAVSVTLNCDMGTIAVDAAGIHVAGSLQMAGGLGMDWTPGAGTANQLTDPDGDKVYSITFDLPAGNYEYKFLNGDAWGKDEGVPGMCATNGNRGLVVEATPVVQTFCFARCENACPTLIPVTIKLSVNMSGETVSANGVHVAGSFQSWNPATTELLDPDGDKIYEGEVISNNGSYQYKFINGNAWGGDEGIPCACAEGGNRGVNIPYSEVPVTVPTVCFRSCTASCPSADLVDVIFRVDMTNEILGPGGLFVAGSWQTPTAWVKNLNQMTDANGDGIYEYTAVGVKKTELEYKFFNGDYTNAANPNQMNTDAYAEVGYDFKLNGCGHCGTFNNRLIDATNFTGTTTAPIYVYNSCDVTSSVKDLSTAGNIKLAGNPMSNRSYLQFTNRNNDNHNVRIVDVAGKVVRTYANFNGNELMIEKGNLVSGLYFVQLMNEKGEGATLKLSVL